MITINAICQPVFQFKNNHVTGYINVDPEALLDSIFMNIALDWKSPYRLSTKRLITEEISRRRNNNETTTIQLMSGVVKNNFTEISLREAIELIKDFLGIWEDEARYNKVLACRDFVEFTKYIYKCDTCVDISQTANISIGDTTNE